MALGGSMLCPVVWSIGPCCRIASTRSTGAECDAARNAERVPRRPMRRISLRWQLSCGYERRTAESVEHRYDNQPWLLRLSQITCARDQIGTIPLDWRSKAARELIFYHYQLESDEN